MTSTQAQRDYITSLLNRIGVEAAHKAEAITTDMAINSCTAQGEYRTPREVARHCHSRQAASAVIGALKEM